MTISLVLTGTIAQELQTLAGLPLESGGVLLVKPVGTPGDGLRLLALAYCGVPEQAYVRREARQLSITPGGYVPALGRAETTGAIPIWLHTHPGKGAPPRPSRYDKTVDTQLSDLFRLRANSDYYGSLVISLDKKGELTYAGHLDDGTNQYSINRLLTIGERFSLQLHYKSELPALPDMFDRHIRAFGGDVQRTLGQLNIVVVGAGGTGSAVAEQLVRLGVRRLKLIDPDKLSVSNLTRVYGSSMADIGRPKVSVLANHLKRIAPDVTIKTIVGMITTKSVAKQLAAADVIFGCTDDNAGRLILSKLSTYLLIPVIDCGVILSNDSAGRINGIHGRITVLHPGAACLVCRSRIDMPRAASEMLTPFERRRRVNEGYAPSLGRIEPAVVTFTTAVAAGAVGELLERLIGYGPEPVPNEIILRLHDREISTNRKAPRQKHYCDPAMGKIGLGYTPLFLELTW